jgi:hypothetical protein
LKISADKYARRRDGSQDASAPGLSAIHELPPNLHRASYAAGEAPPQRQHLAFNHTFRERAKMSASPWLIAIIRANSGVRVDLLSGKKSQVDAICGYLSG